MRAAVLVESKKPLEILDLEFPKSLDFGQVHVELFYSGICGAQINEIDAVKGPDKFLPHLLGHEGSGIVKNIGPGVTTVGVGDHVVLHWRPSSGLQSPTPKYKWGEKVVNAGWVTTFNDNAIISENRLTVIPKEFDLKLAPLFGCAITTAFGVVNNDANIKAGQSVIIFGIGGVGLNITQAASMVSAYPIIGIDIIDDKLKLGYQFGLDFGIIGNEKKIKSKVEEILASNHADVVIDTTGNTSIIELAYELTSPEGKTILVGVPKKGENISIYSLPLHFNKTLSGSHGGDSVPDVDIPRLIKLVDSKKMNLNGIITDEFSLDQINDAIDMLRSGSAGRIIINMKN